MSQLCISDTYINQSLNEIKDILEDLTLRNQWEPGYVRADQIEGQALQEGSETRIVYNMGRGNYAVIETLLSISKTDHDYVIKRAYLAKGYRYLTIDTLQVKSESETKYETEVVVHFRSPFKWLISLLRPKAFQIEIDRKVQNFKLYCENRHRFPQE